MARGRRLYKVAAILIAAAGITTAAIQPASAATGPDGFTILNALSDAQAHKCNVIGGDGSYQAVVCSDILTYEGATDYYAYGRAEAYCQTASSAHTVVPCENIFEATQLSTGDGTNTGTYTLGCGTGGPACPDGRLYKSTRNWDYSIHNAGGGTCSSNPGSSYDVWDVVWGGGVDGASIQTPDGAWYYLSSFYGNGNDGGNESTGHYYICP
jgi:hypothetical protein